jgi:hypothetical protein
MRSSLIGTLVFMALYIGVSWALFGWGPSTHGRLYVLTALLYLAVTEAMRRMKKPTDADTLL